MKCPKCGHENSNEASFCEQCGNSLMKEINSKPSNINNKKLWFIIGGVAVVIAIVIMIIIFSGNPIVGTWAEEGDYSETITFTRSGTWYTSYGDSGNYEIDGSVIIVTEDGWPESEVLDFTVNNNSLIIDGDYFIKVD